MFTLILSFVSVTRNGCLQPALLLRNSRAIWDHTVLPVTCQRRQSRLNPSQIKLVIDLTTREGCKAKMTWLAGYIPRWHSRSQQIITHSQARHRAISSTCWMTLTTMSHLCSLLPSLHYFPTCPSLPHSCSNTRNHLSQLHFDKI